MKRIQMLGSLTVVLAVLIAGAAAAGEASDAHVKAKAMATKIDAKGKQTVAITLDIDKGWHLYANPVNFDLLTEGQTKVTIAAKVKPASVQVKYPAGKPVVDGKDTYNIYEGRVVIEAEVVRAAGDASPLLVNILVQACTDKKCLFPATVKLMVP